MTNHILKFYSCIHTKTQEIKWIQILSSLLRLMIPHVKDGTNVVVPHFFIIITINCLLRKLKIARKERKERKERKSLPLHVLLTPPFTNPFV